MDYEKIGFTLSPPDKHHVPSHVLLFRWYERIQAILRDFAHDYQIYPEFDNKGRLHFHGWFSLKDKVKFFRIGNKLKKYGYVKWETNLSQKWFEYCKKDVETSRNVFQCTDDYIPCDKQKFKYLRDLIENRIKMEIKEEPTMLSRLLDPLELV